LYTPAGAGQFAAPAANQGVSSPTAGTATAGHPMSWWLGALALLLILRYLTDREGSGIEARAIHMDGYNMASVVLSVIVFGGLTKLVVNKYFPTSGAAALINYTI
jgi:hypothetical protein